MDSVRQLVHELLEAEGYHVLRARNGEEALEKAKNYDGLINLLLTDIMMPGINGHTLAKRLLESRPELKVLFMSGYNETFTQQGPTNPSFSLLQKPYTPADLTRRIREVLEKG